MEIRVVVRQTVRRRPKNLGHRPGVRRGLKSRQSFEFRLKQFCGAGKKAGDWIFWHGDLSHNHSRETAV
jgi:hypothetical protein